MPVAKLSRNFCETFGDELTDELVNCLNTIEATYRLELRDLFEAHFGRFEARFEQRLAETRAELKGEIEQLRVELHKEVSSAVKWSVVVWVPVTLAVIGLYFKP